MSNKYQPCPFCGSGAWPRIGTNGLFRMQCLVCEACSGDHCSESDAGDAWAKRAALEAQQAGGEPDGRLHADGYFTWSKGKRPAYIADRGLPCDFYLHPAPVQQVDALRMALLAILNAADSPSAQGGEMYFAEAVSGPIDDARAVLCDQPKQETAHVDSKAWLDVLSERQRQVSAEGWTPEHDDEHSADDLADAAASYALVAHFARTGIAASDVWPWDEESFKPKGPRRNYVRAAALLLAAIERLDRSGADK
jgi:hypothetical protein